MGKRGPTKGTKLGPRKVRFEKRPKPTHNRLAVVFAHRDCPLQTPSQVALTGPASYRTTGMASFTTTAITSERTEPPGLLRTVSQCPLAYTSCTTVTTAPA